MQVDFKITTWERVHVPENHSATIQAALKDETITSATDIFDMLSEDGADDLIYEQLHNMNEQMTVKENGRCSTIEILEGSETTWQNGNPIY